MRYFSDMCSIRVTTSIGLKKTIVRVPPVIPFTSHTASCRDSERRTRRDVPTRTRMSRSVSPNRKGLTSSFLAIGFVSAACFGMSNPRLLRGCPRTALDASGLHPERTRKEGPPLAAQGAARQRLRKNAAGTHADDLSPFSWWNCYGGCGAWLL